MPVSPGEEPVEMGGEQVHGRLTGVLPGQHAGLQSGDQRQEDGGRRVRVLARGDLARLVATARHYAWGFACGIGLYSPNWIRRPLARLLHTPSLHRADDILPAIAGTYLFEQALPPMVPLTDDELAAISTPTRVLFGKHSTMQDSAAEAERLRRLLPAVEVDVVPGTGHSIALDVPDMVNDRILEHAARVGGRSRELRPHQD
ncbi:alpha/beta hydrolase [Nonomuraea sp. NPDC003804]|uniref:alpha/beta fold hydrolase n=1 Tax=Nonomuraea sp. NPDC003804 TaxID=3154547 RepID=UPI0033A74D94